MVLQWPRGSNRCYPCWLREGGIIAEFAGLDVACLGSCGTFGRVPIAGGCGCGVAMRCEAFKTALRVSPWDVAASEPPVFADTP